MAEPASTTSGPSPVVQPRPTGTARGTAWSAALLDVLGLPDADDPVPAGDLVGRLLDAHEDYVAGLDWRLPPGLGPVAPARELLLAAQECWSAAAAEHFTTKRAVVGLALRHPDVGVALARSGALRRLVVLLSDRLDVPEPRDPGRVVAEGLSPVGAAALRRSPLLGAAFGDPVTTWTVPLPAGTRVVRAAVDRAGQRVLAVTAQGRVLQCERGRVGPVHLGQAAYGRTVLAVGWHGATPFGVCSPPAPEGPLRGVYLVTLGSDDRELGVAGAVGAAVGVHGDLLVAEADGTVLDVGRGGAREPLDLPGVPLALSAAGDQAVLDGPEGPLLLERRVGWQPVSPLPPLEAAALGGDVLALVERERPGSIRLTVHAVEVGAAPGTVPVTALAVSEDDRWLVRVTEQAVEVVDLRADTLAGPSLTRPPFASDRVPDAADDDHVGVAPEAEALALLLASAGVRPPLVVGIFGDWGAGKSWVMRRVSQRAQQLAETAGPPAGFVPKVVPVEFNAWHYTEADVWAALAEEVRFQVAREVGPAEVQKAVQDRAAAGRELSRRRRRLAASGVALTLLVGAAALALWRSGAWSGAWAAAAGAASAVSAVLTAVKARVDRTSATITTAGRGARTGRERTRTLLTWLDGRPGRVYREKAERLERLEQTAQRQAEGSAGSAEVWQEARERLLDLPDYRDRLGLVTQTRQLFQFLDTQARDGVAGFPQRVLVLIDDLDRCRPDKVVDVLSAIHLLLDWSLFTVVLAVDTRWVRQALRAEYAHLLDDDPGCADPLDYLEKIVQLPVRLRPLDRHQSWSMLTGLLSEAEQLHLGRNAAQAGAPADDAALGPADPDPPRSAPEASAPRVVVPRPRASDAPERDASGSGADLEAPAPPAPVPRAQDLELTTDELATLGALVELAGGTPRSVTRYVNTYRLLRARDAVLRPGDGPVERDATALLLALCTGRRRAAELLLAALRDLDESSTLTLSQLVHSLPVADERDAEDVTGLRRWFRLHQEWDLPRVVRWAARAEDVARFSFAQARR